MVKGRMAVNFLVDKVVFLYLPVSFLGEEQQEVNFQAVVRLRVNFQVVISRDDQRILRMEILSEKENFPEEGLRLNSRAGVVNSPAFRVVSFKADNNNSNDNHSNNSSNKVDFKEIFKDNPSRT